MRLSLPRRYSALETTALLAALVSGLVVVLIAAFVLIESWSALHTLGWRLLTDASWHPQGDSGQGTFDLKPILIGSVFASVGAIAVAAPLGILTAVFMRFYAPRWLVPSYRQLIELLAGIPSVVYGLWGLVVLVPLIQSVAPPGTSLLAGILILALMVVPTVALLSDSALASVPAATLQGAAALGMGRWNTVRRVALPAARTGIATSIVMASGRAAGETMAMLMVCGNVVQVPGSIFDPIRTLTTNIALEMAYAVGVHRSALFATGLLLLAAIALLTFALELHTRRLPDAQNY